MLIGGKAWFILGARGRQSLEYFGDKGRSGLGLRFLTIIGGYPIRGSDSGVGLISSPQIDTGGIKVRLMSRESLFEAREEGSRKEKVLFREDTSIKGIHLLNMLFPDTGKPLSSVCFAHFLDKPGNLSSPGETFTTPYLDSINFTA